MARERASDGGREEGGGDNFLNSISNSIHNNT